MVMSRPIGNYPGLKGKVALVTGSAKSIGRGIALAFAEQGAAVVIADMNAEAGERTAAEIVRRGGDALFVKADLRRRDELTEAVERAAGHYGQLDVLVNNASVVEPLKPFLEMTFDDWEMVVGGNLFGAFALSQAAARRMAARPEGGSIINILAIQEERPLPNYSAYSTSKGGLAALTRAMAVELSPLGIRVNGIAVGAVYADSVRRNLPPEKYPETDDFEQVPPELDEEARTLIGRLGRPSDVAKAALFLASSDASFITGSILRVDGGRLLFR